MTGFGSLFRGTRRLSRSAAGLCFAAWLLWIPATAYRTMAQAVPAGGSPSGNSNPADQPLPGQVLGTALTLNQGVNAISAENESFNRFGLGLTASGGEESNFLGTQTDQQNAAFAQFSANAGVVLRTSRTVYFALYQPQYTFYPQFSAVNNYAQSFYQSLDHKITQRTGVGWSTTAARFLSLNQFLPQTLGIGGIAVVVPTTTQLLQSSYELTNVATSLTYRYMMSARTTFTGTLTGAYFLLVPHDVSGQNLDIAERFITSGGNLQLDYQWAPRVTIGMEITPVYVDGLTPSGHQAIESAQATYRRQLTSTLSAQVGAGPLFAQTSSAHFGSTKNTSYMVSASLARQIRQSQFAVGFSRALFVNFLEPASSLANSANANAYLPMSKNWIFTAAASYTGYGGNQEYGPGDTYGGSAQLAYRATSKIQLFALYSLLSEKFSAAAALQSNGFTRNQFSGGLRFNLGNPITRGGVQ